MGKPRIFTTLPSRAIGDTELTALDLRCLAVIAKHDGMSAVKGSGGGCYARNTTLAAEVRTDPTNFSKSLTRLLRAGYVTREPQVMDKRRFTLRVQYPAEDSWRMDQLSPPQHDPDTGEIVGEATNRAPEIVGDGEEGNGGFSKGIGPDYISLKEELDFDESKEKNSTKWRHVDFSEKDTRERGLPKVSLRQHLPARFNDLASHAQVPAIERAFKAMGCDPDRIPRSERTEIASLLDAISEAFPDEPTGQQAARLFGEIAMF